MNEEFHEENFCPEESLFGCLDLLKHQSRYLVSVDTEYLVEEYKRYFPSKTGMYEFTDATLVAFEKHVHEMACLRLVDIGHLDIAWSDEHNNFVFAITPKGAKAAQDMKKKFKQ